MILALLWWGKHYAPAGLASSSRSAPLPEARCRCSSIAHRAEARAELRCGWSSPSTCARRCATSCGVRERGVVQISAYIDEVLASLLPTGAVTGLANAQLLYTLPVSLFGLSVSAAALPAMSGAVGLDAIPVLRDRVNTGLRHIAFFVVPSAVAFLTLGDVVAAALFQTGRFTYRDAVYVWGILAGSSIGLLATAGSSVFLDVLALRDTRKPLRFAVVHVGVATVLGYLAAIVFRR